MSPSTGFAHACKRVVWYRALRHLRKRLDRRRPAPVLDFDLRGQAAGARIRALLEGPEPGMVSRFGGVELRAVLNLLSIEMPGGLGRRLVRYLRGETGPWWWDDCTSREMIRQAGFFPVDPPHLERFARMFLADAREIDILGSWSAEEDRVPMDRRPCRVPFGDLEPYRHPDPWSEALAGRRVLVVHPFATSIASQYRRRELLFRDPRVLPAFDLVTYRSVQSLGGDCPDFPDWFAALEHMQRDIAALDFDVALIGAGAYGMALAAFIKRDLGRKAVHLGGSVQILFGIRGKRWDAWPEFAVDLYNDAWIRPGREETPNAAGKVEGGCYW